jgi:hypothetical protein
LVLLTNRNAFKSFLNCLREEIRRELPRKIAEKFDQARGPEPQPVRKISEEERLARTEQYAELLYRAALKKLGSGSPIDRRPWRVA